MTFFLTRSSWTKWYTFWAKMPFPIVDHITNDVGWEVSSMPEGEAVSRDIQFLEKLFPKLELPKSGGAMKVEISEQEDGYFIRKVV